MAINKKAEMKAGTVILIAVVALLVLAYVNNWNGFADMIKGQGSDSGSGSGSGSSGQPTPTTTVNCPSTGITSLTINVQDALTSTATNVNSEYFVFNGNKLIKEGTTGSDGTDTISLTCGQDFKIMLVNTTAGNGVGLYSETFDYPARIASDSINKELVTQGTSLIVGIENPNDPAGNANATIAAGGSADFLLKFKSNHSERGYNQPIILCQVNISGIKEVVFADTFSNDKAAIEASKPDRVSATSNYKYYTVGYPEMLPQSAGTISIRAVINAQASTAPSTADSMSCKIVDKATWKTSSYKTATSPETGFLFGAENTETLADVGGTDSAAVSYYFVNSGGY